MASFPRSQPAPAFLARPPLREPSAAPVSYPLRGFLVAHVYRQTKPRPLLMAVLLALLANISIHGTLVACCFAGLYGWKHLRSGRTGDVTTRNYVSATAIFVASLAVIAVVVFPPKDLITVATPTV